ncbi:pyridoxal-phosphate dependent enzyme, partial [Capsaspora owczarzaki ATCC 30864]|uniref:Pyridoxal-phosphate dependent enzyme n=1 Tax=Capsaspora owczarzaki (strain ATCC 30864) TaxID=595528 RepID=A0A0D2U774_CAPO3
MSGFASVAYHCRECGYTCDVQTHPVLVFRCHAGPQCNGAPFTLIKTQPHGADKSALFPIELIRQRPANLWRYREAIPIMDASDATIVSLGEGMTPLVLDKAASTPLPTPTDDDGEHGTARPKHYYKLDHLMPTGSYKDRGASVLVSKLNELGVKAVVEDSSGNAGSAIAAYAARAGQMECTILCPASTSVGKLAQIQMYRAHLQLVNGTRADTTTAVFGAAANTVYASHNWNPFFMEGGKTVAFEIVEQLGWQAPSHVVCPVGFGSIFLALHLGFSELLAAGVIATMPRLHGVQSTSCAPLLTSIQLANGNNGDTSGTTEPSVAQFSDAPAIASESCRVVPLDAAAPTLAEGITATNPMRGKDILRVVAATRGSLVSVTDAQIEAGLQALGAQGLFVEPTSAVVVHAYRQLVSVGVIRSNETV